MAWTFAGVDPEWCPSCGGSVERRDTREGPVARCVDCERAMYRNPVPNARVTVVDGNRALVVQQSGGGPDGGWAPPGGHLEECEDPAAGAARELREETGLSAPPGALELVGVATSGTRGWSEVAIGFAVPRSATDGTVDVGATGEIQAARFVAPDELPGADRMYGGFDPGWIRRAVAAVE